MAGGVIRVDRTFQSNYDMWGHARGAAAAAIGSVQTVSRIVAAHHA